VSGFAYDDVPYDTEANADTHPSAIATLGRLAGLMPALPSSARVLEIGCGNGENLLAAATYLPAATFVGFDLAETAIAAGNAASTSGNVKLFAADLRDVGDLGVFDYVIAHGLYSWVPEEVRSDLLAVMRRSLAPGGLGFLSANALPGWELRRALRELMRDATAGTTDPETRVREAMKRVAELGQAGASSRGFFGALSAAAREYEEYVRRTTPEEAPFARGVFHDLLAECNDPFSATELSARLGRAGLRLVCESPLGMPPAAGTPFLQVIVQRDDAVKGHAPDASHVADLFLWADLTAAGPGTYKTTTGALVKPPEGSGLARAVAPAPGFVRVNELGDEELLLQGFREGVFTLVVEPPPCTTAPRVASHVRARAAAALARGAQSAVVTNALHRSYRVPRSELEVLSRLDGRAVDGVDPALLVRFSRYLFFCEAP